MQLREQSERVFKQDLFLFLRMQKRTVDPGALRGAEIAAGVRAEQDAIRADGLHSALEQIHLHAVPAGGVSVEIVGFVLLNCAALVHPIAVRAAAEM